MNEGRIAVLSIWNIIQLYFLKKQIFFFVTSFVWLTKHSNLEYVLVKNFCPNKSDNKFMNYRQQTTIFHWNQNETKSHFGGPVWYTGRNAHQIWAEWAVWARWQILNGSQFFLPFNEKWLSVDNISWIYYQICLNKKFLSKQIWQ